MVFKAYRRHCELNVEAPPTRKRDLRDVEVDDLWIEAQDSSEAALEGGDCHHDLESGSSSSENEDSEYPKMQK